ncbi:MAG: anion transporter, partial [Alphaproteobacteria bacterium]|nr:anion transporter [Alphaproteobacteria bacterium]
LLYLPLSWWILARVAFRLVDRTDRGGAAALSAARAALGPWTASERRVGAVASSVTLLWIIRPLVATPEFGRVSDTAIALVGALVLFALPGGASGRLLDWATTRGIPWGVLLLFGGGLSLADAVARTGLADWIGGGLGTLADWPPLALILALTTLVVALSEFASNTALIATMLPVVGALADGLGLAPLVLAVPATLAASCAFMLPVATPPNAIVYAAGHLRMRDMLWAGLLHNIVGVVLITLLSALLQPRVLP